jgi:purine-binding chemotaxis protein CheW
MSKKDEVHAHSVTTRGNVRLAEQLLEYAEQRVDDKQREKFLTFLLGSEVYGIELKYVTEIIGIQAVTEVPELPEDFKGIINLRGRTVPVMDVRMRFKKLPRPYNDRTCIVVVDIREMSVGLIVDSVAEVLSIAERDIVPPPDMATGHSQRFIKGIGKVGIDVKMLLDCDRLLQYEDVGAMALIGNN